MTFEHSDTLVEVVPGPPGGSQSWDFTDIPTADPEEYTWVDPEGQPGSEEYPTATHCYEYVADFGTMYYYYLVDGSGITILGGAVYVPPDQIYLMPVESSGPLYPNPITYGSEWDVTLTFIGFSGETDVDSSHFEVDGWGTVTDVAGTFNCLRIYEYQYQEEYEGGELVDTNEVWEYEWWAPEWGQVCRAETPEDVNDFSECHFERVTGVGTAIPGIQVILPAAIRLEPAWPNPFNPATTIGLELRQPAELRLAVYDLLGREVAELARGRHAAGSHKYSFDGSGLASGWYVIHAEADGGGSAQQKVLLVK